jgi:SAM-dependent methyltransferase
MNTSFEKNWDDYAKVIYDRKLSPEWKILREVRESHWEEFFNVTEGEKILDAGCGHGEYTIYALREKAKVWAFDYSGEMVKGTQALLDIFSLKPEKLTINLVLDIPYPDEFFDQVFCLAVIDHLDPESRKKAMSEVTRVLKKGGRMYINVPNRFAFHGRIFFYIMAKLRRYPAGKIKYFTPAEVNKILNENGLKRVKTLGMTILPPFSGFYTTDLRRVTFLPEFIIKPLDKLYLVVEKTLRRIPIFKPFCWHHYVEAIKL